LGLEKRSRPWWLWIATASFVGYFLFLNLSVHYGRELLGFSATYAENAVFVASVVPGGHADRAGLRTGDRLEVANGLTIRDQVDLTTFQAGYPIGRPTSIAVDRAGVPVTLTVEPQQRVLIVPEPILMVVGLALVSSVVLGFLLAWRGDGSPTTLLAAWLLASLGTATLPLWPRSMAFTWAELPLALALLLWPAAISSVFAPALMFVFCALVPKPVLPQRWLIASLVPIAAVGGYVATAVILTVHDPVRATRLPIPGWLEIAGPMSYALYVLAAAGLLVVSLRRATDITDRRRIRTLLAGTAGGGIGLSLIGIGFAAPGAVPQVVITTGAVIFSALPFTFAYATLRHRLFDLRVIVRLGLQYALARGVILALIPITLLAMAVDVSLHADQSVASIMESRGWNYAAVASILSVVYARRHVWMTALDRRFFRERYAAQQILRNVVEDIGRSADFDAAAQKVVSRIDSALHPVMTAVMRRPRTSTAFSATATLPAGSTLTPLQSGNAITQVVRALGRPVVFGTQGLRDMPADQQSWLIESHVEIVVPIATDSTKDEAVLVLGPRRSEEPYSREDLDLLATIGASLGLLVGRSSPETTATMVVGGAAARIGNRYRIERLIGEGGMGIVYAATDETLERPVAIKVIKDQHLTGDALARFQREARTAASLSHPHIVTVHDFGVDDAGSPYLVMELLEGQSLRAAIKADGRMPTARALPILAGLASAVAAAHAKGVIHRDLKPENVFLVGNTTHAKILDYGIAKAVAATTFATPGVLGTLAYMAPEQAGGGDASPAWDVWALSVIAFEMLSGAHPFGGGLPVTNAIAIRTLAPDLNDDVASAIDRALSLNPSARPATANAFSASLQS